MAPKFSLQPVLDYRQRRVEALEVELSQLQSEQQLGANFLDKLQDYQENLFKELQRQQNGDLDLTALNYLHANLRTVEDRIHKQQDFLKKLAAQVEEKRMEMINARQDEETLNKLKEKAFARYQEEQAREENRQQDDIYISQAFQRSMRA